MFDNFATPVGWDYDEDFWHFDCPIAQEGETASLQKEVVGMRFTPGSVVDREIRYTCECGATVLITEERY